MTAVDFEEQFDESQIVPIENNILLGIFGCRTVESVEAAVTYARFLSSIGITPENYTVFLKILEIENHWVIDALVGNRDPFLMLSSVQPNPYMVHRIFAMLTKWRKGEIYFKNLSVILGVLESVYSSPEDGYRIYPLRIADLNALGKHLKKENGQDEPLNRVILEILNSLAKLEGRGNTSMEEIAIHATAIQNAFFDNRRQMEEVIPKVLLSTVEDRAEIAPRKLVRMADEPAKAKKPAKKKKKTTATGS